MHAVKTNVALCAVALVTGCGGGGSVDPAPATSTSPEGLYYGRTSTGRSIIGLVLDDGSYYVIYSSVLFSNLISGVVQGDGTSNAGTFSSGNARDFNLEGLGVLPATVTASFVAKQSLNGATTYNTGSTTSFSGTYDAKYELTPTLVALAGTYDGALASSAGVENASVTVSTAGVVAGSGVSGCAVSGSVAPRTRGNVYNIALTFGGSPCRFPNQTLTGIAYFEASTNRLYASAPNASRADALLFVGMKP